MLGAAGDVVEGRATGMIIVREVEVEVMIGERVASGGGTGMSSSEGFVGYISLLYGQGRRGSAPRSPERNGM